jgi:hybrid cluster-associated redox disulfide protein
MIVLENRYEEPVRAKTITPKSSVASIMDQWPETVPIFLRYNMACVGCGMAKFESLEDAAWIYGIAPEEILREVLFATGSDSNTTSNQQREQ